MEITQAGRLASMEKLLSKTPCLSPQRLYESLQQAGAKPCAVLLTQANEQRQSGNWKSCHDSALTAREYAWEQLHSGPSWQAVAPVHREAYGVAGVLVSVSVFLSGGPNSLNEAVYNLDLVALMAGGKLQEAANRFVEEMESRTRAEETAAGQTDRHAHVMSVRHPALSMTSVAAHQEAESKAPQEIEKTRAPRAAQEGLVVGRPPAKKMKGVRYSRDERDEPSRRDCCGVRRIQCPPLDVFQREFMKTTTPVILTGVMAGWPAMGHEGHESEERRDWSDLSYIRRVAGRRTVPVEVGESYTAEGWRQELMTIGNFIDRYIDSTPGPPQAEGAASDKRAKNAAKARGNLLQDGCEGDVKNGADGQRTMAYLAQHQLFDQIPRLRRDVITPDYCALLLEDEEDDAGADCVAMNAWFGPSGTVSPLHNDPFHNLLAQVVGKKRVLLVDRKLSSSVYPRSGLMRNTSDVDAANPDLSEHPLFKNVMPLIECELQPGEMLYIPPLFWHHIESLETSFSVSFWWGKRRTP